MIVSFINVGEEEVWAALQNAPGVGWTAIAEALVTRCLECLSGFWSDDDHIEESREYCIEKLLVFVTEKFVLFAVCYIFSEALSGDEICVVIVFIVKGVGNERCAIFIEE